MANIIKHPQFYNPNYSFPFEEWKTISDQRYSGRYYISNYSRVKSFYMGNPQILSQIVNQSGYLIVGLEARVGGKLKTTVPSVHRLVAIDFIPNPNGYPFVNHLDHDKQNNLPYNLEWCTPGMNSRHYAKDHKHLIRKYDDSFCEELKHMRKSGMTYKAISEKMNVPAGSIRWLISDKRLK